MRRLRTEKAVGPRGFSRWIRPVMMGYKFGCCDCGLVHEMEFRVLAVERRYADGRWTGTPLPRSAYRVIFRARRAERYTAKQREQNARRGQPASGGRPKPSRRSVGCLVKARSPQGE